MTESPWRLEGACGRVLIAGGRRRVRPLQAAMRAEGYAVERLVSQSELVARGASEAWDLVVVTQRLEGGSGLQAIARLRRAGCWQPTILLSRVPDDALAAAAARLGAVCFDPPLQPQELVGYVRSLVLPGVEIVC